MVGPWRPGVVYAKLRTVRRSPGRSRGGDAVGGEVAVHEVAVGRPVVHAADAGRVQGGEVGAAGVEFQKSAVGGVGWRFEEEDQGERVVVGVRAVGVARPVQDVQDVPFDGLVHGHDRLVHERGEQPHQVLVIVGLRDEGEVRAMWSPPRVVMCRGLSSMHGMRKSRRTASASSRRASLPSSASPAGLMSWARGEIAVGGELPAKGIPARGRGQREHGRCIPQSRIGQTRPRPSEPRPLTERLP